MRLHYYIRPTDDYDYDELGLIEVSAKHFHTLILGLTDEWKVEYTPAEAILSKDDKPVVQEVTDPFLTLIRSIS